MGCGCEKDKKFPPAVLEIINPEQLVLLRKVLMPASLPEAENPPVIGKYRNVILQYEDTEHIYLYSSDGIPTALEASIPQEVLDRIADLEAEDVAINARIDLEEANRTAADTALERGITEEATARAAADSALSSRIDSLSSSLSAETTAREQADTALGNRVTAIEEKIPAQASAQNQLADKDFVNSSVATNTAYYISNNGQPFNSVAELEAYSGTLTNNDYAFVTGTDAQGNTFYDRYKYNADTGEWAFEYELNNSSFTAVQWAAINSGITSGDVTKLQGLANIQTIGTGLALTNGELSATSTGPTVVQRTGTSTTDVMSQNAVTSMVFADPSTKHNVRIGEATNVITGTDYSVTIGYDSQTYGERSMAIGAFASITSSYRGSVALGASSGRSITAGGMVDIGSSVTSYGYNNSAYRLLTGLYDPQSAHDAATKGYVDNLAITYAALNGTAAPTTATAGAYVGQLYLDTTNDKMYYLSAIDGTVTPAEYTWTEIGGGPNVVQTTGTSTTDVMSQNATTSMVFADPSTKGRVQIGTGSCTGLYGIMLGNGNVTGRYAMSIGGGGASFNGSVAFGVGTKGTTAQGEITFELLSSLYGGYNNTVYKLLTGLYDPQNDHDAATKGYVDTAVATAGAAEINSADWSALWQ